MIKFIFLIASIICGFFALEGSGIVSQIISAIISGGIFLGIIIFESLSSLKNANKLIMGMIGLFFGIIIANLISNNFLILSKGSFYYFGRLIIFIIFAYLFGSIFYNRADDIGLFVPKKDTTKGAQLESKETYKILDTSAIIDGRIADISETGFIDGIMLIPRFVLNELQLIADSSDPLKRQRGRRGLDIINKMQKSIKSVVQIIDKDFPELKSVDEKLIALSSEMKNTKIISNDYNLNRVAEIQNIEVLNINELSKALKPVVLPGEELSVTVIREGKDENQGIGYLEDGTMVVIENGKDFINKKIDVVVTSVLQTTAGRMIFAK